MAKDSGFERDFGYLMPFFDRISGASADLSPEARAELQRLLSGEKEKWQRIRALLGGSAGSAASTGPSNAGRGPQAAPKSTTAPELSPTLTVGSLRRSQ